MNLLLVQIFLKPMKGGDDILAVLGNNHLLLRSARSHLVDQVDRPGQRHPPPVRDTFVIVVLAGKNLMNEITPLNPISVT